MLGPLLIFDKSFLQMLSAEEVFELTILFHPVGTPLLVREIIADLKKDPSLAKRLPVEVVSELARKMSQAHGVQPADFRKLTIANLCGVEVPMFGQVPVDIETPGVREADAGRLLLIDSSPEQRMWKRWAAGEFSTDDQEVAAAWRRGLEKVDLRAVGDEWKDFGREHFGTASNLSELIGQVEVLLSDRKPDRQLELLGFILSFVQAPEEPMALAYKLLLEQHYARIRDFAPYAASVLKLYLSFIGGLARGFLGPRPSHYLDLQYLFYAPFCMVFVSADKFHRDMWAATAGINTFVWGSDLKSDLANRIIVRKGMTQEERKAHHEKYSFYPIEIEGSMTNDLWKRYMRPTEEIVAPDRQAKTIDDLAPEVRDLMKRAIEEFDKNDD